MSAPNAGSIPFNPAPTGGYITLASQVKRKGVEWLWPGRIPLGAVTLLAGDPGLGKSMLTCDLAARVTRGELGGSPGFVVISTAEDDVATTVRPRLEAVHADLGDVGFLNFRDDGIDRSPQLPGDITELDRLVSENDTRLVVIDPLMAHLSEGVNSWSDQSVRSALAPLRSMAERRGCAVVVLVHLNKGLSADSLRRIGGSVGLQGAPRSILLLARDPDDGEMRRVLAHVKCNLAPLASSLVFEVKPVRIEARNDEPAVETARVLERGPSSYGERELLARPGHGQTRVEDAVDFLVTLLADGARPSADVKEAAEEEGISLMTLRRARERLEVEDSRQGFPATTYWALPSRGDQEELNTTGGDPHDHDCRNGSVEPNPAERDSGHVHSAELITTETGDDSDQAELDFNATATID